MSASTPALPLGARAPDLREAGGARGARRLGASPVTLMAFGLLAVYGALRWSTMLAPAPAARVAGLIAVALAIVALGGPAHSARRAARLAANALIALLALSILPISGIPPGWILHLRLARIARGIEAGLGTLPGVLVPYRGDDPWTVTVILLGAAILMLAGGLILASARGQGGAGGIGERRLAASALPLVVMATVPSALATPSLAAIHGVILFVLLCLLVFSEQVGRSLRGPATSMVSAASAAALFASLVFAGHHPWIDVTRLTDGLAGPSGESFDWAQSYGRLVWPTQDVDVLSVRARLPTYWKAENLDEFDGTGWVAAPVGLGSPTAGVTRASLRRWTQRITVTVGHMSTSDVIAAGAAAPPGIGGFVAAGASPGTWRAAVPLRSGASYQVEVYTPDPNARELRAAGTDYPRAVAADLRAELPAPPGGRTVRIDYAPYGSPTRIQGAPVLGAGAGLSAVTASAYGPVLALAERLEAGTSTPYGFVRAVMRYLGHGFTYTESPPSARLPLVKFLLHSHAGYCQQFAGAMALLLRMGGVPARVSDGFTTGSLDRRAHTYTVTDLDAHAWVEAFFPGIGWVSFDPTPASDTAGVSGNPVRNDLVGAFSQQPQSPALTRHPTGAGRPAAAARRRVGSDPAGPPLALLSVLAALALLLCLAALAWRRSRSRIDPLTELERALARCGRGPIGGRTLFELERELGGEPEAAAYLTALRMARYAGEEVRPNARQRRALRRALRPGRGPVAVARALFALPPRSA